MNQFASHPLGGARDNNSADRRPAPEENPSRGVPNELRNFNQNKPNQTQPTIMATNITPLGTRVLVKRIELEEQKSEGGIFLPDTAKEKPQEAEIVALGNGKNEDGEVVEFSVSVGDQVLISKYGGTEVKVGGDECVIVNESDILGILS